MVDQRLALDRLDRRHPVADADIECPGARHAGRPAIAPDFEERFRGYDVMRARVEEQRKPVARIAEAERRASFEPNTDVLADRHPRGAFCPDQLPRARLAASHAIDRDRAAGGGRVRAPISAIGALFEDVMRGRDYRGGHASPDRDRHPPLRGDARDQRPRRRVLGAEVGEDARAEGVAPLGRQRSRSARVECALQFLVLKGVIGPTTQHCPSPFASGAGPA